MVRPLAKSTQVPYLVPRDIKVYSRVQKSWRLNYLSMFANVIALLCGITSAILTHASSAASHVSQLVTREDYNIESAASYDHSYVNGFTERSTTFSQTQQVEMLLTDLMKDLRSFISGNGFKSEAFRSLKHIYLQDFGHIFAWIEQISPTLKLIHQSKFAKHMLDSMSYTADVLKAHQSNDLTHQLIRGILDANMKLMLLFDSWGEPDLRYHPLHILTNLNNSVTFLHDIYTELPRTPTYILPLFETQYEIAKIQIYVLSS